MNQLASLAVRLTSALACVTTLSLFAVSVRPVVAADAPAPDLLSRVVDLTNAERQQAGLSPLSVNPNLAQAAQGYADVLASGDCFEHTCGPVPDFSARDNVAGYAGWTAIAENIAGGQRTPEQVVAAWMASPGHRANILNPAYSEIGVGAATGGRFGVYWTQEFGARRDVPPAPAAPPLAVDTPVAPTPPDATQAEQMALDPASAQESQSLDEDLGS